MPHVICNAYDELVTVKRLRVCREAVLHQVCEEIEQRLALANYASTGPRWVAGRTTRTLCLPGCDLRLTPLPTCLQAEVHSHTRHLHIDVMECRRVANEILGVAADTKDLESLGPTTTKRFTLHADVVGLRLTGNLLKRIVSRSRAVWVMTCDGDGRTSGVRKGAFQAYDKLTELRAHPSKAWIQGFWKPWDGSEGVTRIEIRFSYRDMQRLGTDDVAVLWADGLDRFSLHERKGLSTTNLPYRKCPEARLWRQLRALRFDQVANRQLALETLDSSVPSTAWGRGQALAGLAVIIARSSGGPEDLGPLSDLLGPFMPTGFADFREDLMSRTAHLRRRLGR